VRLAANSLFIAVMICVASVGVGVLAAYAFSRMKFWGRETMMIGVLAVLMLPAVATLAPLYVMLSKVQIGTFNLRDSLFGVALAVTSGTLPFAIWNMKGTSTRSRATWRRRPPSTAPASSRRSCA